LAGLVVPALDRAALPVDLVRTHARVADQHDLMVRVVGAQDVENVDLLDMPAARILPDRVVQAIVEIEMDEVLELAARGREQLLADPDMVLHGPADIEEQQQFYRVVPLGHEPEIEPAGIVRGVADRLRQVELEVGALAGELAQAPERDLDVAGAELDRVVEVAELALVPDLDRPAVLALAADPDALGVVAGIAVGRSAGGADPFLAARMPALLLGEPLAQRLHQLVPAAERLDLRLLLGGQKPLGELSQPFLGKLGLRVLRRLDALEAMPENPV